jgi:hypothetical protein
MWWNICSKIGCGSRFEHCRRRETSNLYCHLQLLALETRFSPAPPDILSGSSVVLHFDSSKYFEKLCEALPANFSEIEDKRKQIWYFLQRIVGRWTRKEFSFEDYWNNQPTVVREDHRPWEFKKTISQDVLGGMSHVAVHLSTEEADHLLN